MLKNLIILSSLFLLSISSLATDIPKIRAQIIVTENSNLNAQEKMKVYNELFNSIDNKKTAENSTWKGILKSTEAQYVRDTKGVLEALKTVKDARKYLDEAIKLNQCVSEGAALNILGMLYYKVPPWPIAFANDSKAQYYFNEGKKCAPENPDILWREAEFLIAKKRKKEAKLNLEKALILLKKTNRKEDPYIKKSSEELLLRLKSTE